MQKVILIGIKPEMSPDDVRANLAALFKATPDQIDHMLAEPAFTLKSRLSDQVAEKYRVAIDTAGGICRVESEPVPIEPLAVDLPATTVAPVAERKQSDCVCPACGALLGLNDVWCAECGINVSEIEAADVPAPRVSANGSREPEQVGPSPSTGAAATNTMVIVGGTKSVGIAILLGVFFGPLGLLYASVLGGIIMFFVSLIVWIFTFGFGLFIIWPICAVWAVIAANSYNQTLLAGLHAQRQPE
jgi:hypothetical protein